MLFYFIYYSSLYKKIKEDIIVFCNKFDMEFDKCKIKTKREILIHFSLLEILNNMDKNKLEKPIVIFDSNFKDSLFEFSFKQISKLLVIPFYFCDEKVENGIKIELCLKSNNFYNHNQFSVKKLKKQFSEKKHSSIIENIINFKCFSYSSKDTGIKADASSMDITST